MKISTPRLISSKGAVKLSASVATRHGVQELWYSIPAAYEDWFAADRCDGFVVGLLLQAMKMGEDIEVEGPLSSRLWHSLDTFYIPMMAGAFPQLQLIKIRPSSLINQREEGKAVATGFSGGIDSFASIVQHLVRERDANYRINQFLFHNVGSHGNTSPEASRRLFFQRFEKVKPFTDEVSLDILPVDSNLGEVLPIDFVTMHAPLNASVPLVLQKNIQRYYYASAYKYADCGVHGIEDIAYFDPFSFHLLSTEGLDCVSTGCQMSRVEKTRLVADYELSHRYLNVCVDPAFEGRNCSVCFKCRRTILTLELLRKTQHFKDIFDYDRFRSVRSKYIHDSVLNAYDGSFEAEIAELARAICEESWANTLRRTKARKDAVKRWGNRIRMSGKIPGALKRRILGQ